MFVFLDRVLELGTYYALFSGLSLILTVILNPVGIAGKTRADIDAFRAKRAGRKTIDEAAAGGGRRVRRRPDHGPAGRAAAARPRA